MSILWVAVLAIGGSPLDNSTNTPSASASTTPPLAISRSTEATIPPAAEPVPRSGKELADAAHAALAHWAKAKGDDVQAAARELLAIYREVLQDKKLAVSQRERLRMSLRSRLMQLETELKRTATAPESVALAKKQVVLAQQGLAQNGGGANAGFGGGQNGNNNNADAGQDLVDLIENTISPKQWDINGGNCTIYYWKQQHAIVVRATDDVHADISDALDQLNQAGH